MFFYLDISLHLLSDFVPKYGCILIVFIRLDRQKVVHNGKAGGKLHMTADFPNWILCRTTFTEVYSRKSFRSFFHLFCTAIDFFFLLPLCKRAQTQSD